ncbi:MAG: 50S ribosomal protein L30 [Bradymonadaceae bacterium]|nr:50S ribosomal protein L30 [Lujinxingiaceae bacterium]
MGRLKVSLVRGLIGQTKRQRDSVRGLGLKRRHDSVVVQDTPSARGLIGKVSHLVTVEKIED